MADDPRAIGLGITLSGVLLGAAFAVGMATKGLVPTVSVALTSLTLEVLVGAAASMPLGFDPAIGALVASLANLAPAPFIMVGFDSLVRRWNWLSRKLEKAEKLGAKYGKYGVWVLAPLAPFLGVYVTVSMGVLFRFRPVWVLVSLGVGVLASALLTTSGLAELTRLL